MKMLYLIRLIGLIELSGLIVLIERLKFLGSEKKFWQLPIIIG